MSSEKPKPEGEPDKVEFALRQIELDTQKAEFAPSPEQFAVLADKVKALELPAGSRVSAWEAYCGDLEKLLAILPKQGGDVVRRLYSEVRQQKFYHGPVWQKFYDGVLDFFHQQAAEARLSPEEKGFWEACFGKYLEISIKYKNIMQ